MEGNHPGIQEWDNAAGIHIFRLLYEADEDKGSGEKVWNERQQMFLSPWADAQERGMTDPNGFRQEYLIDFSAKSGALLYPMQDEATIEPLSALPQEGTDYYFLDPHPRVPHAHLWIRVDKWGDAWAFGEFWPSKIYGKPGNSPEDDNRYRIRDYVETVKYLETESWHTKPFERVIDYAARGFYVEDANEEQRTVQQRYQEISCEIGYPMIFKDCIKDNDAGIEAVMDWLKPREVECSDGIFRPKSKLHIIRERCPELIWQMHNNRFQNLTPIMAERQDPSPKALQKRNHLTDLLKYAALAGLRYIGPPAKNRNPWKPMHTGVAY